VPPADLAEKAAEVEADPADLAEQATEVAVDDEVEG